MPRQDDVFKEARSSHSPFSFDEQVADVFDDMLARSVPFYQVVQGLIVDLARRYYIPGTSIVDIGCSLGTTCFNLASAIPGASVLGIDESEAMIERARLRLTTDLPRSSIEFRRDTFAPGYALNNPSVAVLSLLLQFVRPPARADIVTHLFESLTPGGCLILFEKTLPEHGQMRDCFGDAYYHFKAENGYSQSEIANKRTALENVLVPFTPTENLQMLHKAGFSVCEQVFQWYVFNLFLAVKS